MELSQLSSVGIKAKRRLGQGHGTGRMKTGGRGTKGQNARGKRALSFEGGALPLIKRMPFLRGKAKNKSFGRKPIAINISELGRLPKGAIIDIETLITHKVVSTQAREFGVKLMGDGKVEQAYTVKVATTKAANEKITKAGGKIE